MMRALTLSALLLVLAIQLSWAQVPQTISYQGQLTDASGEVADDGPYDLAFSLYDSEASVTPLWSESHLSVGVENGIFSVILGEGTPPVPLALPFDQPYWLEVQVGTTVLAPRIALTSSPYSLNALSVADGAVTTSKLADNAVTTSHITNGTIAGDDIAGSTVTSDKIAVGQVVKSINGKTDAVTLAGGDNVSITTSGNTLTVSATGLWKLGGNAGTTSGKHFLGTTDDKALELRVNGLRALCLEPDKRSPNVIGGSSINSAIPGVYGATIAGGGSQAKDPPFTIFNPNRVTDNHGTVGGGLHNTAGDGAGTTSDASCATVGGGSGNKAYGRYSTIGGGSANEASDEYAIVSGGRLNNAIGDYAAIGGGHNNIAEGTGGTVGGGGENTAESAYCTVGGGYRNVTVDPNYHTVSGGSDNIAGNPDDNVTAMYCTVGGGYQNIASGGGSTVPGGTYNIAGGSYSFAGGVGARIDEDHDGTFLFADSTGSGFLSYLEFNSAAANEFAVRCTGGARFVTAVDGSGNPTKWAYLAPDTDQWQPGISSDRNMKTGFAPVDNLDILERLASISVETWSYNGDDLSIRHIGPMAQEFHRAFGLGNDDKSINSLDTDGVALAAIQGLYELLKEKDAQIATQQQQIATMEERLKALEARMSAMQSSSTRE